MSSSRGRSQVVCHTCNTELLLSHKVSLNNVRQHVNSASHRQEAKKFGKANIPHFCKRKGNPWRLIPGDSSQGNSFVLDTIMKLLYMNWTIDP